MERSHIAFVIFPHHPHVGPTLPIVSVLIRRGHKVTYVTSDKYRSRAEQLGAEIVHCRQFSPHEFWESSDNPLEGPLCRFAVHTLAQILPLYERDKPDLIVYDYMALAGRILAHKLSVPVILTGPGFARCKRNWEQQMKDPNLRKEVTEATQLGDQFLQRHGITSGDCLFYREKLNIYPFPKIFQPEGDIFDESRLYAGRLAGEQPHYGDWEKGDYGSRPVVLVSTSTTYVQGSEFFKVCIKALSGLNCHVLLSIGDSGDAAALQPLPDHVEIVQHTSHVKILPYVDAFICLAGIITASEAMYHGVPLVVMSLGILENEWESEIFERLGIAIHLRGDAAMNVEAMRSATVRALTDPGIRNRAREIQHIVQREPGAEETANRVEAYLEAHK